MTEQPTTSVLRRMLAQTEPAAAEVPLTIARAVRLSAARAAENSVGLKLSVRSVSEEMLALDDLLARLSDDTLLLRLSRSGGPVGTATFDTGLVAAIVESQTMGKLLARAPEARHMTAVDASLSEPLIEGLLAELSKTVEGTSLEAWLRDVSAGGRFADLRQIGLSLPQEKYRLLRISIDLGVADREGTLILALPMQSAKLPQSDTGNPKLNWSEAFHETVGLSRACLPVELHRFRLSLDALNDLEVGQVLSLPGCRVDKARLVDVDGTVISRGRLGQMGGKLALRIEVPQQDMLQDLGGQKIAVSAPAGAGLALPDTDLPPDIDDPEDVPELGDLGDLSVGDDQGDLAAFGMQEDDVAVSDVDLSNLGDLGGLGSDADPSAQLDLGNIEEMDIGDIDLSKL